MSLKNQTLSGFIWTFSHKFYSIGIRFIVQAILARIIAPDQFGLIAMIGLFFGLAQSIVSEYTTFASLIRMPHPKKIDYSTVFVYSLFISIILYLIIFAASPLIANFYQVNELNSILRVFSLSLITIPFVNVKRIKLLKDLNFKLQSIIEVPSFLISALLGVYLGYHGYEVWALVYMHLAQVSLDAILYWIVFKWNPGFEFNLERFKYHFSFSNKLMATRLIESFFNNVYSMVIGKFYDAEQAGYYARAQSFSTLPGTLLNATFSKVFYPVLSKVESEKSMNTTHITKKFFNFNLLISCLVFGLLIVNSEPLILIVFSEKWARSITLFQIICYGAVFIGLKQFMMDILNVFGHSNKVLQSIILGRTINILVIFITLRHGIEIILVGQVLCEIFNTLVMQINGSKVINFPIREQFILMSKLILPFFIISFLELHYSYILNEYHINNYFKMIILSLIFAVPFSLSQWILNKPLLMELTSTIKDNLISRAK